MSAKDNVEGPWYRFVDSYAKGVPAMYTKVLAAIREDIASLPDTHFLEVLTFVRVNGTSPTGMKRLQKRESFERLESLGRLLKKEDPGGAMALAILEAEGGDVARAVDVHAVKDTAAKGTAAKDTDVKGTAAKGTAAKRAVTKKSASEASQAPKATPGVFKVSQICRPIEWMRV